MQEERGFRETGKPGDKHVIIDELNSFDDEIGVAKDLGRRRSSDFGWLKNIFVAFLLVGIVVGSFWISFLIGKRVLTPVKPLKSEKVVPIEEDVLIFSEETEPPAPVVEKPAPKPEPKPEPKEVAEPSPITQPKTASTIPIKYYKVHVGSFASRAQASSYAEKLKSAGYPTYVKEVGSSAWTVQVGAFNLRSQAESLVGSLKTKGFGSSIVYE